MINIDNMRLTPAQKNYIEALGLLFIEMNNTYNNMNQKADNDISKTIESANNLKEDKIKDDNEQIQDTSTKDKPESNKLNDIEINDSNKDSIVLGKKGRKYLFNHDKVKELVENGISIDELVEMSGVSVPTIKNYLKESELGGLIKESSKGRKKCTNKANKAFEPLVPSKKVPYHLKISKKINCPICNKEFVPAEYHVYNDGKGNKVCSYSCSIRAKNRDSSTDQ